jgi:hypothetical protein
MLMIFGFPIAFGLISAANGIVIRIALICSNIVLVPMMRVLECFGVTSLRRNQMMIYHSMGLVGA